MEDSSSLVSLVSLKELDVSKCVVITNVGVRELASLKFLLILRFRNFSKITDEVCSSLVCSGVFGYF